MLTGATSGYFPWVLTAVNVHNTSVCNQEKMTEWGWFAAMWLVLFSMVGLAFVVTLAVEWVIEFVWYQIHR